MRGPRFSAVFRTLDGRRFKGFLADDKSDANLLSGRRLLRTEGNTGLGVGELFTDAHGTVWLAASHSERGTFRAIAMDETLPWSRRETLEDPVTGLPRTDRQVDLGLVHCTLMPIREVSDQLELPIPGNQVITGAALKVGDRLGEWRVERVERQAGVTYAEVR